MSFLSFFVLASASLSFFTTPKIVSLSSLSHHASPFVLRLPLSDVQLVQQQALVAQSAYLSPVATVAAVQMQQMAALNANGIIATPITPITPSSGILERSVSGSITSFRAIRGG